MQAESVLTSGKYVCALADISRVAPSGLIGNLRGFYFRMGMVIRTRRVGFIMEKTIEANCTVE